MLRASWLMLAVVPLAACEVKDGSDDPGAATAEVGGVTRDKRQTSDIAVSQPVAPVSVIQSQPGPDGSQVDLLSVRVTGDILTVSMRCSSDKRYNSENMRISGISVIDDATSQQLSVLRNSDGGALVSGFNEGSSPEYDNLQADCGSRGGVIWAKFPAPPATSQTVSINFPGVGPFDGIPVQR